MESDLRDRARKRELAAEEEEEHRREVKKKEEVWFNERMSEWKERETTMLASVRLEVEASNALVHSFLERFQIW